HWNLAVRAKARKAARELGVSLGQQDALLIPDVIAPAALKAEQPTKAVLHTSQGKIVLRLLHKEAPTTTLRFVELAKAGYYDGVYFHRVIPGFVAQTGDPTGTGYGGPHFTQRCENNRLSYTRGMVGMALAGRDTGGSQFFINTTPQPHLDRHYPIFAEVLVGMDVVDLLTPSDVIQKVSVSRETQSE
ncbi:UNVERIFIED_CONTAM: hypothetical protein GTU68_011857, partial [Idotea baltica]|nr:hypothetical protein [Idotea baltica]